MFTLCLKGFQRKKPDLNNDKINFFLWQRQQKEEAVASHEEWLSSKISSTS